METKKGAKDNGKPTELSDKTFHDFVGANKNVVVDFWAPWCGPCRMVGPIVEELAEQYAGRIAFGKMNVDDNQEVASEHGIMSIPTLVVFSRGKLVDRIVGAMPKPQLEAKIKQSLKL